jgi:hypothetical protein
MDGAEVRRMLEAAGEEIVDDDGHVLGYVAQPARFKLNQPYLGLGGFLVVIRDEETGTYIATEYDALPHPKTRVPYPAGHSEVAWRTTSIDEAYARTMAYFAIPK